MAGAKKLITTFASNDPLIQIKNESIALLKINIAISHRQKLKFQALYSVSQVRCTYTRDIKKKNKTRMKIKEKEETIRKVDFETGGGRRGERKNQYKQR